jgi:hypothetical protein
MSNLTIAQNGPANITIRGCSTLLVLRSGTIVPVATANSAGTVIVGGNLTIDANGVLSANTPNMSGYVPILPNTTWTGNSTFSGSTLQATANGALTQISSGLTSGTPSSVSMQYQTALDSSSNPTRIVRVTAGGLSACLTATNYTNGTACATSSVQSSISAVNLSFNDGTGNSTRLQLVGTSITFSQLTGNTVYSANSLLTQGYADGRYLTSANMSAYLTTANAAATYLPIANFTYGNLPGTPNLSLYLTTANAASTYYLQSNPSGYITASCLTYSNISGTPNLSLYLTTANAATTYQPIGTYLTPACLTYANLTGTPPIANATQLGSVKVGANLTIDANGVLSANANGDVTKADNNTFTGINTFSGNVTVNSTLAMNGNLVTSPKIQGYTESATVPTISGGNLTLNLASGNVFGPVALNAAISNMTFTNLPASGTAASWTLLLKANGTAVSVTWPASVLWAAGSTPTITSTANKTDVFTFLSVDGGTSVIGFKAGQNY